jgi:hypothetical protein
MCLNYAAVPVIHFSQRDIPNDTSIFLIFFGTGVEVLTVERIHNATCVRQCYERFGGVFWSPLHRASENGVAIVTAGFGSTLRDVRLYSVALIYGPPECHQNWGELGSVKANLTFSS